MEKNENKKTIEVAIFTGGLFGRGLFFFFLKKKRGNKFTH